MMIQDSGVALAKRNSSKSKFQLNESETEMIEEMRQREGGRERERERERGRERVRQTNS